MKLNHQGLIPFDAFLELFKVIRKNSRARLDVILKANEAERRLKLAENAMAEYREIVLQQTKLEEQIYMDVSNKVLQLLDLTEDDF